VRPEAQASGYLYESRLRGLDQLGDGCAGRRRAPLARLLRGRTPLLCRDAPGAGGGIALVCYTDYSGTSL